MPALRHALALLSVAAAGVAFSASAMAEEETLFELRRIDVHGNTLLDADEIARLTAPFIGKNKGFRDIQMALEAVEGAYRRAGYTAVQVFTPEQELTGGNLRLEVQETAIATVNVTGNRYFSEANIRNTLPSLREGETPNARLLSENVQLANENPAKQIDLTLALSDKHPDKLDATVKVADEPPVSAFVTADNTGSESVGHHRIGVGLRHSNLWDRDHTFTFGYTTSPDAPQGVKVDIFSLGYRVPLYGIGDSLDFFFAKSSVNAPSSTPGLSGALGLSGKGDLYGIRWNHYFPRQGEWSTKFVAGWDIKSMQTTCTDATGNPIAPGTSAGCTPYTVRPVSGTYSGNWQRPGAAADFNAGIAYNLPTGSRYDYTMASGIQGNDRYSLVASNRQTKDDFTIIRLGGSYSESLFGNWLGRIALSYQSSLGKPLVPAEQIGLAGATAVRGFHERVVATDDGYVANLELYAPDVATLLEIPGSFRPLVFLDNARGWNYKSAGSGSAMITQPSGIMSAGIGFRYNQGKDVVVRFDLASVLEAGPAQRLNNSTSAMNGEWRGHFNVMVGF